MRAWSVGSGASTKSAGSDCKALCAWVAVLVWLALSLRVWANGQRGTPDELNEPVAALAGALRAAGYDGRSPIVAGDPVLAGQLRLQFVQAPVSVCRVPAPQAMPPTEPPAGACAVQVLRGRAGQPWLQVARGAPLPPPGWWHTSALPDVPVTLEFPYLHAKAGQTPMSYQFLWRPAPAAAAAASPSSLHPSSSP